MAYELTPLEKCICCGADILVHPEDTSVCCSYCHTRMGVSRFTQEELTRKPHSYELEESGSTVLCLDYRHNGIGSNSCGPVLQDKYELTDEAFRFSLKLIPEKI